MTVLHNLYLILSSQYIKGNMKMVTMNLKSRFIMNDILWKHWKFLANDTNSLLNYQSNEMSIMVTTENITADLCLSMFFLSLCILHNVTWPSTILQYNGPYYNYTNLLTGPVRLVEPSELLTDPNSIPHINIYSIYSIYQ